MHDLDFQKHVGTIVTNGGIAQRRLEGFYFKRGGQVWVVGNDVFGQFPQRIIDLDTRIVSGADVIRAFRVGAQQLQIEAGFRQVSLGGNPFRPYLRADLIAQYQVA